MTLRPSRSLLGKFLTGYGLVLIIRTSLAEVRLRESQSNTGRGKLQVCRLIRCSAARGRRVTVIVYTFNRRELWSPITMAVALVVYVVGRGDWLGLVGLPLIYLSWCSCSPNLSPVNACLPTIVAVVVLLLGAVFGSTGFAVAAGAGVLSWLVASIESAARLRPELIDAEPGAAASVSHVKDQHGIGVPGNNVHQLPGCSSQS
jgi:hypothetical protein